MYYFKKEIKGQFEDAIGLVTEKLKVEGFGIITEINITKSFKEKLDVDFPKYQILGACNPGFAHKALSAEPHIGTMLPCNVIVRELDNGNIEVAAVDPIASMSAIKNEDLFGIATEVRDKLKNVIDLL
ncbi:MAG: DUF302 domain-containing protein [Bacteriovoracaceae bacterium]|nr:DUF302 domain-containing protein [Bacteriovoracaceae bacterium]